MKTLSQRFVRIARIKGGISVFDSNLRTFGSGDTSPDMSNGGTGISDHLWQFHPSTSPTMHDCYNWLRMAFERSVIGEGGASGYKLYSE